mgnify:CR=1 FL=1
MTLYGSGKSGYIGKRRSPSAVTQITTADTAVTISATSGQITTATLTAIAGAEHVFVVTNTSVKTTSVVTASMSTYTGTGTPIISIGALTAGTFTVTISNVHASTALTLTMVINFVVTNI